MLNNFLLLKNIVNLCLVNIFIICLYLNNNAQSILGTYKYANTDHLSGSRTITFFKDKTFNEEFSADMGARKGKGIFSIKEGFITLSYQKIIAQDSSQYKLELIATVNDNISRINLKVLDAETNNPLLAMYGCRDHKNEPIFMNFTDDKGVGNVSVYMNKALGYFTIDYIGYHRINIPVKKLMGKSINVTAWLKPQQISSIGKQIVKYKIQKIKATQLILEENGALVSFERIK